MNHDQIKAYLATMQDALTKLAALMASEPPAAARPPASMVVAEPRTILTLKQFLQESGLSYSSYRNLRKEGKTPKEMRLSQRMIRFSRDSVDAWSRTSNGSGS